MPPYYPGIPTLVYICLPTPSRVHHAAVPSGSITRHTSGVCRVPGEGALGSGPEKRLGESHFCASERRSVTVPMGSARGSFARLRANYRMIG